MTYPIQFKSRNFALLDRLSGIPEILYPGRALAMVILDGCYPRPRRPLCGGSLGIVLLHLTTAMHSQ